MKNLRQLTLEGNGNVIFTTQDLIEFMALQNVSCQLNLDAPHPDPLDYAGNSHDLPSEPQDLSASSQHRATPPDTARLDLSPKFAPGSHIRIRRSDVELKKAAECIHKGMTFQNVSDIFHIPISTIRFYMARNGILPQRRRGRNTSHAAFMVTHQKLPNLSEVRRE